MSSRSTDRLAVVYVRQSTIQQVAENRESTDRQYALDNRAIELGWSPARILVIDEDQGKSGDSAEDRFGFQRLLAVTSVRGGHQAAMMALARRAGPIVRSSLGAIS